MRIQNAEWKIFNDSDDNINSLHAADQNEPTESSPKVHLAILRCVLQIKTVVEQIKG